MQIIQELYSQAAKSVYEGLAKQQEHQQKRALQQQAVQQLQAQQLQQQLQQLQPLTEEKVEETYEALKNSPPKNSPSTLPPNITYGQSIPINPIVFSTSTGDVGLAPEGSPQSSAIEVARKTMKELEG